MNDILAYGSFGMFRTLLAPLGFAAAVAFVVPSQAGTVVFLDTDLASGNPVTKGGITVTTSTVGGSIGFIGAGIFTGLHLGGDNSSGSYTLAFSRSVSRMVLEFDALSDIGTPPPETLTGFNTGGGVVSIDYTNQFGTSFDGTTITSTENDGQGIITYTDSQRFPEFGFLHNQGAQSGFVIERLELTTIPLPASGLLLLGAGALAALLRRRPA